MPELPFKPRIPSNYYVRSEAADNLGEEALHFVSEQRRLKFKGQAFRRFEKLVIPLLDGRHSFEQIAREVDGIFRKQDLAKCLRLLARHNLLEEGANSLAEEVARRVAPQLNFFHEINGRAEETQKSLANATVTVFGMGGAGATAAVSLAAAGVGTLRCVDALPVLETDVYLSPVFQVEDVSKSRSVVTSRAIKGRAPQVKVLAHDTSVHNEDEIRSLVEGADFVICCLDAGQSDLIFKLNRVCLASGIRWTSCTLSGAEIILGPTVHPFDGPCYLCYRMRVVACSGNPKDALAHQHYLDERQQDDTATRENLVFGVGIAANLVGLEALKELTTVAEPAAAGRIVIFNLLNLTSFVHVVLRKPWCSACFREEKKYESSELTKRLRLDKQYTLNKGPFLLVSDRTGIIKNLSCVTRGIEEPNPPVIYQATLSHFDLRKTDEWERTACGKGQTASEAIARAIGEAVENYCAFHFDASRIRVAKWDAVEHEAIAPPEFVLYSTNQYERVGFPYQRWNPQTEVPWIAARELQCDRAVLVPASLIYLLRLGDGQEYFCSPTSNGLAAGTTREAAVLHGLYELIERDGFLIHWMNRLPGQEIEFPADDGLASSIVSHYRRYGVEVRVFNVSTDLPAHVMMSVAIETLGGGPATVIGLGCHLDPRVALLKSLLEICQAHPGERLRYQDEPPRDRLQKYEDVRSVHDHSAFLTIPERLNEFDFLLKHGCRQKIEDLPNKSRGSVDLDLDECVNSMSHQGYRVCYVELTTPDVIDCGLHVVRTIATALQPIHFGFGMERLGGRRLFEVPLQLGFVARVRTESDLNPCPHPLA